MYLRRTSLPTYNHRFQCRIPSRKIWKVFLKGISIFDKGVESFNKRKTALLLKYDAFVQNIFGDFVISHLVNNIHQTPDTDTFYAPLSLQISHFKLVQNCSWNALTSTQNFTAVVWNIFLTQLKTQIDVHNFSY